MAVTTKWPNDVNAGKRLIAAFNIAITSALKKHCNLSSQVTTDYFVVNKVFILLFLNNLPIMIIILYWNINYYCSRNLNLFASVLNTFP